MFIDKDMLHNIEQDMQLIEPDANKRQYDIRRRKEQYNRAYYHKQKEKALLIKRQQLRIKIAEEKAQEL